MKMFIFIVILSLLSSSFYLMVKGSGSLLDYFVISVIVLFFSRKEWKIYCPIFYRNYLK